MKKQSCVKCNEKIDLKKDFLCPFCGKLPISLDLFAGIAEMADLTVKLNHKTNLLVQFFKTLNLPHTDERNQLLGIINQLLAWLNLQLVIYRDYGSTTNSPIAQKLVGTNQNMTMPQLTELMKNFDHMNRRSFLTALIFQVEVFLKRINKILPNTTTKYGYKNLVRHVLKELKLIVNDDEKFRIMYFPAIVRNSLYTNGIHTEKDLSGKISGISFSFKKGNIVEHAGWRHVYFFCDKMLDVIKDILKHPLIGNKPIETLHLGP